MDASSYNTSPSLALSLSLSVVIQSERVNREFAVVITESVVNFDNNILDSLKTDGQTDRLVDLVPCWEQ